MWTMNLQVFKVDLEKPEEPEIKSPTSVGSSKKQESSGKNIYFCFIDYAKAFDCVDHNKLWKFFKTGFNNMWTVNFQMFKLVLEKAKEPEIKLPTSVGSSKKQESCRKSSTSAFLTVPKPLCGSQQIVENSSRDGNSRPSDLTPKISV